MTFERDDGTPPPGFLDEILACAEALASARTEAVRAGDWGDSTAAVRHADDAAGHRLALAVLVSAERAAGVDEGRRLEREDRDNDAMEAMARE